MISEEDLTIHARKGLRFEVDTFTTDINEQMTVRGRDGPISVSASDINFDGANIDFFALEEITFNSVDNMGFGANFISMQAPRGNIEFAYTSSVQFNVAITLEAPNSLAIPMRQETLTSGSLCPTEGEFVISHNNFYYQNDPIQFSPYYDTRFTKDSGIMICYCDFAWHCRTLSQAYYT